ncbi:phospholipase A [Pseudacidovorax intermedius]|uniref:Phospholipase A1 n=1 Tax=Pseudacidovorax intermedius TaxID=433924 RepID=A0A147GPU7_9BURK|nr:phospholipase A [Pseudacidovorax intermedius]KTT16356.1 phospholipase [Pseudacidovorax intermedius]
MAQYRQRTERARRSAQTPFPLTPRRSALVLAATAAALALPVAAQTQATQPAPAPGLPPSPLADAQLTWQQCARLSADNAARLACFDRWALQQQAPAASLPPAPAALATAQPPDAPALQKPVDVAQPATRVIAVAEPEGCRDRQYSTLSRFWELEEGSSCGTFTFRGYRPLSVSITTADGRPQTPTSPAEGHTGTPTAYQPTEMRIGLSVRTKLAQGLLTGGDPLRKDSLWFGYTQQSTWQVFNGDLSRPFRTTDHEPELMYAYPVDLALPGGWRWRYAGLGIVHQSNGQSLPLSRSWNRVYLMGGMELDNRFTLTARVWQRIKESAADDDNPDITKFLGHSEIIGSWNPDPATTWRATVRGVLGGSGKGAVRLEWLRAIGDPAKSDLRWYVQLFHGYGDTLVDYNRKRTVLGVGLSLVDF